MLRIGLTGGIGSGKSTVGRMLAEFGLPVFDADIIGRDLLAPGQTLTRLVCARFPDCRLGPDELDRAALAERVFADRLKRVWLEGLLHPAIAQQLGLFEAALPPGTPIAVVEGAVLLESRSSFHLDGLLVCWTPKRIRLERIGRREASLSRAQIEARMAAQLPEADKIQAASHFIDNGNSLQETRAQVEILARHLLAETGGMHEPEPNPQAGR